MVWQCRPLCVDVRAGSEAESEEDRQEGRDDGKKEDD